MAYVIFMKETNVDSFYKVKHPEKQSCINIILIRNNNIQWASLRENNVTKWRHIKGRVELIHVNIVFKNTTDNKNILLFYVYLWSVFNEYYGVILLFYWTSKPGFHRARRFKVSGLHV